MLQTKPINLKVSQPIGVLLLVLLGWLFNAAPVKAAGPGSVIVNLAPLDGVELTPDNILGYQIQSNLPAATQAQITGTVRYRQSGLSFSYSLNYTIRPGVNMIDAALVHPKWTFSSSPLRELFQDYKKLPQGAYEYCVEIAPLSASGEAVAGGEYRECLYQKVEDIFLINLVTPENKAKLYEYNPMFSWVVNYPFASALTYRIRVAEIKPGQNTQGAIARNNPVYQEGNLVQTSQVYPVYGRPLEAFQPYSWTVDAYYKGILLGGAEPWKFTIIEDSEYVVMSPDQSYYEFEKHFGETEINAVGELRLKYVAKSNNDTLSFFVTTKDKEVKFTPQKMSMTYSDNLFKIDLKDRLNHNRKYILKVLNASGKEFNIPFIYYNPLFVKYDQK